MRAEAVIQRRDRVPRSQGVELARCAFSAAKETFWSHLGRHLGVFNRCGRLRSRFRELANCIETGGNK